MKIVMIMMFIGMMGIMSKVNAQHRPGLEQREGVLIAQREHLRQAGSNNQRIEQARLNQQRQEQMRIKQARIKHERVKKHRVKQARVKYARIKAAREEEANDGLSQPARRRHEAAKKKRIRMAGSTPDAE